MKLRSYIFGLLAIVIASPVLAGSLTLLGAGKPAAGGGEATVLIDASTSGTITSSTGTSTATFSGVASPTPNVGSGPNGTTKLCLILAVHFVNATGSVASGMTWDVAGTPQTMTSIPGASTADIYFYYLMSPNLGQKNVSVTWTGTAVNGATLVGASFVNVNQTGGVTSFPNVVTNTGSATGTPTVSISTSPTTRKIIAAFVSTQTNLTAPVNGTDTGHQSVGNVFDSAGSYDNGTATSMAYTGGGTGTWEAVAVAIKGN